MFKTKLTAIIALVLMVVAQASLTAESKSRKEIDKFLKSYEKTVVAAEKAAKSNNRQRVAPTHHLPTHAARTVGRGRGADNKQ